ncbi:MAG: radical SAM protein, partial [Nitrospinaceae bacterium]|nr:radical SAM protein [Nitrospinaceae bacterium]
SHEWGWMPDRFDMIAFSISFEPDYLNAALILDYFRLPLERKERNASYPLILAGGSAIFINPEPLADCIDVFFIGEGEGLTEPFFRLFADAEWNDPRELLCRAAAIRGVYVPQFYHQDYSGNSLIGRRTEPGIPERIDRHWVKRSADLLTHSEMHNGDSAFKDMSLMEVTRGCVWACRFCTAGFIYRPPRLPDLNLTYRSLERVLGEQGRSPSTVGLVGPSVTDHPDLLPLARKIVADGKMLSFSSLRMETLTDELVDLILKSGQKTLTLAVDGSSERMRRVINKAATDDFIVEKCRFLTEKGVLHLKIYSIIGLPGETEDDIDCFIALVERIMKAYISACSWRGNIGQVTISLNPLIPKPGTPFQWHPMESVSSLKKKFMRTRKTLGRLPHLKLSFGSPNEAYLQTYLSRGDRRVLAFFKTYLTNGRDVKQALQDSHPSADSLVYRQYEKNDALPWDIIDHGYKNDFLWDDYQRGLKEGITPVCDTTTCKVCGIC